MDYRLPGLDGVQATAPVVRGVARGRRDLPHRGRRRARARGARRGGRGRLPLEGRGARRDRRRDPRAAAPSAAREPHRREHGDRPRLDRRLPRRGRALPELARRPALRPLRRRELPRLRRPRPGRVLRAAARRRPSCPTTSQPTPGDFPAVYEELARLRAGLLAPLSRAALRHLRERGRPRPPSSATARARDRHRDRLGGDRDARARDPAPARARHDRRGDRRARGALPARARAAVHGRHARVPAARRADRPGGGVRRRAAAGQADPLDPGRRGRAREAGAGSRKAFAELAAEFETATERRPASRLGIAHADAPQRAEGSRPGLRRTAARRSSSWRPRSARSSARTPGRAPSGFLVRRRSCVRSARGCLSARRCRGR